MQMEIVEVTKFMMKEHVDAFFEDGTLRLSSFETFCKHPDEQVHDHLEGKIAMQGPIADGGHFSALGALGTEHYVFCTTHNPKRIVMRKFGYDDGFRITNIRAFGNAVKACIPGCESVIAGPCEYSDDLVLPNPNIHMPSIEGVADADAKFAELQQWSAALHGNRPFFRKRTMFRHQEEFRFIWFANGTRHEHLFIKCPEARQCCKRIVPMRRLA